jgi:hypothetical protein
MLEVMVNQSQELAPARAINWEAIENQIAAEMMITLQG